MIKRTFSFLKLTAAIVAGTCTFLLAGTPAHAQTNYGGSGTYCPADQFLVGWKFDGHNMSRDWESWQVYTAEHPIGGGSPSETHSMFVGRYPVGYSLSDTLKACTHEQYTVNSSSGAYRVASAAGWQYKSPPTAGCNPPSINYFSIFFRAVCAQIQPPPSSLASGETYCPTGQTLQGWKFKSQSTMPTELANWNIYTAAHPMTAANPGAIQTQFSHAYPYGHPLGTSGTSCGVTQITGGSPTNGYSISLSVRAPNASSCPAPGASGSYTVTFSPVCGTDQSYPGEPGTLPGSISCKDQPVRGNPILTGSGVKFESETDYQGGSSLQLHRYYQSQTLAAGKLSYGWNHEYERHLKPVFEIPVYNYFNPDTPLYASDALACEEGWLQKRHKYPGMLTVTAKYEGTTCKLYRDSTQVNTLAIHRSSMPASEPIPTGMEAVRPNGGSIRFHTGGSGFIADTDQSAQLVETASGYQLNDDDTLETYDTAGKLLSVAERGGATRRTLSYNGAGELDKVTDEKGRELNFSYDGSGRLDSVTDPASGTIVYGYDSSDRLSTVTYPDSSAKTYHYERTGQPYALTGVTDENNHRYATWDYDDDGRAILSKHAGDAEKTEFDFSGGATTVTGPLGDVTTYTFTTVNGHPKLTGQSQPCTSGCGSSTAAITYDSNGYVATRTDFKGNVTSYVHNSRGLETKRTEAVGTAQQRIITTTWHATFRLPTKITEPLRSTTFTYDASGNLLTRKETSIATSADRITTYTWNSQGLLATIDGPRTGIADITYLAYDSNGNLTSITRPMGIVTLITSRDAHGNPLTIEDPNGLVTTLTYDARQRLTSRSAGGLTTAYDYDDAGLLSKVTQPDASFIEYHYDDAHRLTGAEDSLGNRVEYTLDLAGNRVQEDVYDPGDVLKRSRSQVYNSLSQLTHSLGADGQDTAYTYDDNGNLATITDPLSHVATRSYDALNRLVQVTDPASGTTAYTYNDLDQVTSVTDPRGLVTSYTYNAFGDVTAVSSPDSGSSSAAYNAADSVTSRTDAKGQTTLYSYDNLERLIKIRSDSLVTTITYDQGANGIGRLTGMSDSPSTTAWTYDALGRLSSKSVTQASTTFTTSYGYDSSGHLASQTLPSGKVVGINWSNGQPSGMTLDGNPLLSNLAYEPFGPASGWDYANSESIARTYDLDGRMTGHSLGTLDYDDDSRITGLTQANLSFLTGSKTYGYDNLDRLTGYTGATSIGYTYDANGNRSSQNSTTLAISSASNRIDSITNGSTTVTPAYDANGSTTLDAANTYAYNDRGRLLTASNGSYTGSYRYNGLGQRVRKLVTVGGVTSYTLFNYDEAGHMLGEYELAGTPIQETVWMGDTPVATVRGSNIYYIHSDQLNTPRQIDDASGNPVWVWDSITFGSAGPNEDPLATGTAFKYNLRFPGQYYDYENGLFQNWHRDYDASLGRYLESDPIGLLGGINTYGYVSGNPVDFIDITGLLTSVMAGSMRDVSLDQAASISAVSNASVIVVGVAAPAAIPLAMGAEVAVPYIYENYATVAIYAKILKEVLKAIARADESAAGSTAQWKYIQRSHLESVESVQSCPVATLPK